MAATKAPLLLDGKNFSLHQRAGGRYRMTPLYDILSAWPVIGPGARQLHYRKAKLAMSLSGRNRHYGLAEIQTRHWQGLAVGSGVPGLWDRMQALVRTSDGAIQRVLDVLPAELFGNRNLLMPPPLRGSRVLGMDPGIPTGTKCAVMDETGKYLASFVVYQERDALGLGAAVAGAVKTHRVDQHRPQGAGPSGGAREGRPEVRRWWARW